MTAAGQLSNGSRPARSSEFAVALKEASPKKPAAIETLIVVRADLANPHLLLACSQDDNPERPARPLRVRVRDSVNFTRRMQIPAALVDGYTDLYDLARSLPRKKGKW